MNDVFERSAEIISESQRLDIERIKPESRLLQDLEADEMDMLKIASDVEEEFGIDLPDSAVNAAMGWDDDDPICTVAQFVELVKRYLR